MLLNKTQCTCGKEQSEVKFDYYEPNFDKGFYGGRVDMFGYRTCECGRELKGYFTRRNTDQALRLIDLEVIKDTAEVKKIDLEPTSSIIIEDTAPYIAKTYEEMTWEELKAIAKEKGIKTNKGRKNVIKQLREN